MSGQLTIVSYNIASLAKSTQGDHPKEVGLAKVLAALRQCEADVICLQEVSTMSGAMKGINQAKAIADQLDMSCHFEQSCPRLLRRGTVYGNAILCRHDLQMVKVDAVPLPGGSKENDDGKRMPGANEGRVAAAALIRCAQGPLLCVCTHLALYNARDTDNATCIAAVRAIGAAFGEGTRHADTPAVLAGDLNAQPDKPQIEALDRDGWEARPSAPTFRSAKIDYILSRSSPAVEVVHEGEHRVLGDEETQHASDHRPLVAKVRLIRLPGATPLGARRGAGEQPSEEWGEDGPSRGALCEVAQTQAERDRAARIARLEREFGAMNGGEADGDEWRGK
jgi:endonuclease/exonuclease/phosphatase family metal-dependent hydrolase